MFEKVKLLGDSTPWNDLSLLSEGQVWRGNSLKAAPPERVRNGSQQRHPGVAKAKPSSSTQRLWLTVQDNEKSPCLQRGEWADVPAAPFSSKSPRWGSAPGMYSR